MANDARTTLTFLGAAGTVTGSKYLVTTGDRRVLIDSGMFQGEKEWRLKNWEEFPTDPRTITDIVVTHAHLDHVGYLPALVKAGYDGPIWCTPHTKPLAEIVLKDAGFLQEREAEDAAEGGYSKHHPPLPLYTIEDVERTLPLLTTLEFDTDYELTGHERRPEWASLPAVTVRMTRAGHILGSASITLRTPTAHVLFSGDLGRHDHPVLRPRDIPEGAPYVLIESTYGDREHPDPVNLPHEGFADIIRRTIERGGSVLVPAFAVDRTEAVLKVLTEMRRHGRIPDVPIIVNSPMATAALDVYRNAGDELRPDLAPEDFVDLPNLREVRSTEESRELTTKGHGPSIVISSSGMATGGRVVHHLARMLPDARNAVVLTGYQGAGTRGRQLVEGATEIKIQGRYVPVNAEVLQDTEFSVHADASDLIDWLRELSPRPETIFCVHGEKDSAAALARRIKAELGLDAVIPGFGEVVLVEPSGRPPLEPARAAAAVVPVVGSDLPRPETPLPEGRLRYRCLTGPDDASFCRRVSEALDEGYVLHGSPALVFDGENVRIAQAVVWGGD
ncbi:DUF1737 domain-containing protein [Nigerium sp.]|uniref:DUF1737 domain-containing protein n=1 Tax=Nigerium sp. TaxID=2042655 RepID=UPI0032219393